MRQRHGVRDGVLVDVKIGHQNKEAKHGQVAREEADAEHARGPLQTRLRSGSRCRCGCSASLLGRARRRLVAAVSLPRGAHRRWLPAGRAIEGSEVAGRGVTLLTRLVYHIAARPSKIDLNTQYMYPASVGWPASYACPIVSARYVSKQHTDWQVRTPTPNTPAAASTAGPFAPRAHLAVGAARDCAAPRTRTSL